MNALGVDPPQALRKRLREPAWGALRLLARPTARWRVLPDFLIIGAQRSGTTSLQHALVSHPGIKSPRLMKGVHYFDTAYHRGLQWYRSNFHTILWQRIMERHRAGALITGEASPYYLFHPAAPQRIAADLPDARLIVLLRNPVERTISHYKHEVRFGHETLSLLEAIEREPERLAGEEERIRDDPAAVSFAHQHHSYVSRSLYAPQLRRLFRVFPPDQVLVLQSEPVFEAPRQWFARILDFIGAEPWTPATYPHLNPTPGASIDASERSALTERFAEPNRELFEIVGGEWPWR